MINKEIPRPGWPGETYRITSPDWCFEVEIFRDGECITYQTGFPTEKEAKNWAENVILDG